MYSAPCACCRCGASIRLSDHRQKKGEKPKLSGATAVSPESLSRHTGYPAGRPQSSTTDTTLWAPYRVLFFSIQSDALNVRSRSAGGLPQTCCPLSLRHPKRRGGLPSLWFHFIFCHFCLESGGSSAPTLPGGLENFLRSKSATMISPSPRTNRLAASGSVVTWLIFNLVLKRNRTGNASATRHGPDQCVGS